MTNPGADGRRRARHLRPADVVAVAEPDNGLSMRALLTGQDSHDALSLTEVALDGAHRRLRNRRTTRTYYVLEGAFDFAVEQAPVLPVRAGEVLVLEPGTAYAFAGKGRYLVLNTPAFRDGDDEYLDGGPPQRA